MEQRITSGECAPGERLPGILDIAAEWGIGEVTARRVLRELRAAGLAYMEPRIGTFAAKTPKKWRLETADRPRLRVRERGRWCAWRVSRG
jgi:DNA-binding transcriptional regulator YhcF (GntR family)